MVPETETELTFLADPLTVTVNAEAAGTMLAVLPVIIVYLFAQKRFIEGISMTGMKS